MKPALLAALAALLLATVITVCGAGPSTPDTAVFKSRLLAATTRHLNLLLGEDGSVATLKGKGADGEEALAFYRVFEITGDPRFRKAALALAERVLKNMRATKFGVLPIKEKEKADGRKFIGGGPPALGFYTANTPRHYTLADEPKRGFQLGLVLIGGGFLDEGIKIMDASLKHFACGNAGMDGVHAAAPSAVILARLRQ